MTEQILLHSGSFDGLREIGGFGQPLHALYPQIKAVIASELEPDAVRLLAEPVVDRANNRIDWYTEGEPESAPVALSALPDAQRQTILAQLDDALGRWRELAQRYAGADDTRRAQLGAVLQAVLSSPAEANIFLVNGQPVITGWGFSQDRPWEQGAEAGPQATLPPAASAGRPLDIVVPEIVIPELKPDETAGIIAEAAAPVATAPVQAAEPLKPTLESPPMPAAVNVVAKPEVQPASTPSEPAVVSSPPLLSPPEPAVETPPEVESQPVVAARDSAAESPPVAALRYVVVGSRYFWGVCGLAILLVLIAAIFNWQRAQSPTVDGMTITPPSSEASAALTRAQTTETELHARLERLATQLTERRGQCKVPTVQEPAAGAPAIGIATHTPQREAVLPPAALEAPPPGAVSGVAAPRSPAVETGDRVASSSVPSRETVVVKPATETPPPVAAAPNLDVRAPETTVSKTPQPTEALEQALTEAPKPTTDRGAKPVAPPRQPQAEAPVKAEPTAEERREFASRMSAAGAATGEITVTLLWNSQNDLDLVVRCPSGRQLDYRRPTECGGALDVDANANRGNLSSRPVENMFWPAGKALPGAYEVAVRYAVRKDDDNPRETPFQVRLSRGSQESLFKGVIMPNAVLPITTFTVER